MRSKFIHRKFFLLYVVCLLFTQQLLAQTVITGKVTDAETKEPLAGATVRTVQSNKTAVTGTDGSYSVTLTATDSKLEFTFVGYGSQLISSGGKSSINVSLTSSSSSMEDVIVVGYGTQRRKDLTGSISSVNTAEINAFPAANVMQALSGRAAGVQVKQNTGAPGSPVSIRIRGSNSIIGENEPLYIIDGFPGSPNYINTSDIESVDILKDASATAIYGSRGANGVVIITTRRGKAGKSKIDFESSYGRQTLRKKLDVMNSKEYMTYYNEVAVNETGTPVYGPAELADDKTFDWQGFVFEPASIMNNSLTVSGGNEKTRFLVSAGVFNQPGIIKRSDFKRYSLRANLTHDISDKFTIDFNANLSRNTTSQQNSSGERVGRSLISVAITAPPTLVPYNEDGSYTDFAANAIDPRVSSVFINPLIFINEISDHLKANNVMANASISYKPLPGLVIKVYGGINNIDSRSDYYRSLKYVDLYSNVRGGFGTVTTTQFTSVLNENTISYNKTIGTKHNVSFVAGFTYQDFLNTSLSGSGEDFLSDITLTDNLAAASLPGFPGSTYSDSKLFSYLGRANYNYDDRFFLTATFRADGSSKYSAGNKWAYFPSAAFAWKLKNEKFLEDVDFISDLKFRASWGLSGSQAINPYSTLNILTAGKTVFGSSLYNTFAPGTVLPNSLKWETTRQTNIGVDVAFANNKFRLTADYYVKSTYDLLNIVQLPSSLGFTTTLRNVGEVENKGFEFFLETKVFDGAFKWDLTGNIAFNRSNVKKLANGTDILRGLLSLSILSDNVSLLKEGQPMSSFYGYLEDGYTADGNIKWKDLNKDGVINYLDKAVIGDSNPDFIYGLNSNMSFKNFELSMFFQGSQGNDLVNASGISSTLDVGYGVNLLKDVYYNHWTPENTNAKYPKPQGQPTLFFSDRFIEDGSFLRLRNIELAYNIPQQLFGSTVFRYARVYVSAQNFLTITKYSWWDPEVNSLGGPNSTVQGVDHSTYPTAKTFMVGVKIGI